MTIGCRLCEPFGSRGYRFSDMVIPCECTIASCTCGSLNPSMPVPAPAYDALPSLAGEAINEQDCPCFAVRRTVTRLNTLISRSAIPGIYAGKLIRSYRTSFQNGSDIPGAKIVVSQALSWLTSGGPESAKSLFLYGVPGSGKTLLACALLLESILRSRKAGLFCNLSRGYFQRLRNTFDADQRTENTTEVFNHFARSPLLVLDDVGVERGSAWEVEWLYNLIDARYQSRGRLIITSNNSMEELNILSSGRIASRLRQACTIMRMPDVDLRQRFRYG